VIVKQSTRGPLKRISILQVLQTSACK
jgi:hypothetical protein